MRNNVKIVPFGKRLAEVIDNSGMTHREFAEFYGVSYATLERYLKSQYCDNGQFLFGLWKETGETMDYLMGIGD